MSAIANFVSGSESDHSGSENDMSDVEATPPPVEDVEKPFRKSRPSRSRTIPPKFVGRIEANVVEETTS